MPTRAARRISAPAVAGALGLLMACSVLLRTGSLHFGYWIDEAIAVGIASHPLTDIPHALARDGSPPLYYLLLHGWIALFGSGEIATRALSELFAVLAVPVAWWAGKAVGGQRAGVLAAAGAATCPFLTYYAQETRMYSLVVVLSLAASGSFALAFLRDRRGHVVALGVWLVLLLYTHDWGLFLAAAMGVAWLWLWRAGRVPGRDGVLLAAAVALAYAPWVPTLSFQALHTAAPWSERPSVLSLLAVPAALLGAVALVPLGVALIGALRKRRASEAARVLAAVAGIAALAAWIAAQVQPAWAARYLAVVLGPLLLALAAVMSRGGRSTAVALAAVAGIWIVGAQGPAPSNVRAVARELGGQLRPGDVVVSTQPEQVPVLYRYLPRGLTYLTPMGRVADPRQVDWRDAVARLRRGRLSIPAGRRILLVTPVEVHGDAEWSRLVRARTLQWRAALGRLRVLRPETPVPAGTLRGGVQAELLAGR
jgi:mannosyltransferase